MAAGGNSGTVNRHTRRIRAAFSHGTETGGADPDLHPPPRWAAKHRAEQAAVLLRLFDWVAGAGGEFLALAIPVDCVCCGEEDTALCSSCSSRIRQLTRRPFRAEGGAPALVDVSGAIMLPVVAAGVYRDELAQSLLSFKRYGQRQLRESLGRALAAAVGAGTAGGGGLLLVPVPTSTAAYVKRGFSPVHLLLKEAARQLPGLAVVDVLRKDRPSGLQAPAGPGRLGGQKGLGRGARSQRVRGSMRIKLRARSRVVGRPCIIVDDVLTTGATISEAARALHQAGAKVRGAVVLAATRPPDAAEPLSALRAVPPKQP